MIEVRRATDPREEGVAGGVVLVIVSETGRVDKLRNEVLADPHRVDEPAHVGVLIGLCEGLEFMDCDGVEGCTLL